ncbi:putative membrane protein YdjX (TVP38/TMEM64 family) [Bacillus niacini]|uniref:TVP38/TMEM64 family membrane protein n=1 Tax=Neobacillus niacini TaxID=86668 RepID=A0A852THA9_9BACI|nr:TVP38/TMEM64 family protein [Neobacillus niacini]NYE06658.1 putative membrane protein YdjX (TVP38/TMEM64 family) [Neobacillus niacini]
MYKRILSISLLVIVIAIGFLQKDELILLIKEGGILSILISMLFVAICVFFPVIPFPVLAGVIGGVFGTTQGVFVSLTGAMAGTMAFFFLSRYGFWDYAQSKLMKYPKVQEYEEFLNRNSFVAILTCRLIPIIPAPVVNIICGLSKVNWLTFFTSTTIGKIPNILILSYAGASFTSNKLFSFGLYGSYILVVFIIYSIVIYRKMAKETVD